MVVKKTLYCWGPITHPKQCTYPSQPIVGHSEGAEKLTAALLIFASLQPIHSLEKTFLFFHQGL